MYNLDRLSPDLIDLIERDYSELFSRAPDRLLGIDTNTKTVKGQKLGFLTGIQYFAKHTISGLNVCPNAKLAQCIDDCLFSAGRGAMTINFMSRLRKTLYFQQFPNDYKSLLVKEINRLLRKADRENMTPALRLNGTSDIRWEVFFPELFEMFSSLQCYDYTKVSNRRDIPENYDLTFSYSNAHAYKDHVARAMKQRMRLAVVFSDSSRIPKKFKGLRVVPGDDSDLRFLEPHNVAVALFAKGTAKTEKRNTAFVVN
jgi:hypothetical protein